MQKRNNYLNKKNRNNSEMNYLNENYLNKKNK